MADLECSLESEEEQLLQIENLTKMVSRFCRLNNDERKNQCRSKDSLIFLF